MEQVQYFLIIFNYIIIMEIGIAVEFWVDQRFSGESNKFVELNVIHAKIKNLTKKINEEQDIFN